ncbi:MAG TPA: glycosyltransferase family 2 protein [Planctomycetota bacterium]
MTSPRVSICVPTFRGAAWLAACLDTATAQTERDLEIVVCDDASDDDTVAIARRIAAQDARVRVIANEKRAGLAGNWNRTIAAARGEWIKLLCQDDTLAPTCVERMVAAAAGTQGLVICDRNVEMEPGTSEATRRWFQDLPAMDTLFGEVERVPANAVQKALADRPGINFFGEPTASLVHREALRRYGTFHAHMIQLCDLELWARIASNEGLARVRDRLATYRIHAASTSAANAESRAFRRDVLDTLVLYHEYAFGESFTALRAAAAARKPPVDFASLAARELRRARREARNAADPSLRGELANVVAAHPRLGRPLWQLWHRARDHWKST